MTMIFKKAVLSVTLFLLTGLIVSCGSSGSDLKSTNRVNGTYQGEKDTNGIANGSGTISYPNGTSYSGNWINDQLSTEIGETIKIKFKSSSSTINITIKESDLKETTKLRYTQDDFYLGELNEREQRHGHGRFYESTGAGYKGSFDNGRKHGKGTRFRDGKKEYEGTFVNGVREGNGKIFSGDKVIYDGSFKSGLKHGVGTLTEESGTIYKGTFEHGLKEGLFEVTRVDKDGNKKTTEETFKNGKKVKN